MKLEVGMYVRTKQGIIDKIMHLAVQNAYGTYYRLVNQTNISYENGLVYENDILKASHNIIDLIEVGDYVNGCKVIGFRNDDGDYYLGIVVPDDDWADILPLSKLTIYSIVTKKQFESMSYKVQE